MSDLKGPRFEHQASCSTEERVTSQPTGWFDQLVLDRDFLKTFPDETFPLPAVL